VKLRSVNVPATVANKRSHVANGLAADLIKNMKQERFRGSNLFLKCVTGGEKMT
jgi:hypothetical protein